MGVTVSKTSISPLSLASTIFGFISFALTVATILRLFWENIMTFFAAPDEIPDYLGNLKHGLYEERAHLKRVKKRNREVAGYHSRSRSRNKERGRSVGKEGKGGYGYRINENSEGDKGLMFTKEAVRHMIRSFKGLEKPFLKPGRGQERDWNSEGYADDNFEVGFGSEYRQCTLGVRILWLRRKRAVVSMLESLSRIETRRTAREVGEIAVVLEDMVSDMEGLEERIYALQQRMARVVGIRRVD